MNVSFLDFLNQSFSSIENFIVVCLLSLVIFANGLSDAPNSIATCVSTKSLSLKKSVIMASIFSFLGILVMSHINIAVTETIVNLIEFDVIESDVTIILIGAFVSILIWIKLMNTYGIPVSESHALIASLVSAAFAYHNSLSNINIFELLKVFLGIAISVILGAIMGFALCKLCEFIFRNIDRRKTKEGFRYTQITGGAMMSFMHGAQVTQKFIGIFLLSIMLMNKNIESSFTIPIWMMIYCSILISIGIIFGGKKVIKTVGMKLSNLEVYQGAVTDISASICILIATIFGFPLSTSHTKSMSIVGVSATRGLKSVNWNVIRNILLAGIITFPCCGLFAFVVTKLLLFIL